MVLVASGTASGALAGFGFGLLGQLVPSPDLTATALIVGAATVLDVLARLPRAPSFLRPPAVGRQVPIEWGRMFGPGTVALLYGSRLGVGPLTILSTWLWWASSIATGAIGVVEGVLAGAGFGLVRLVVTALASRRADALGHAAWFSALRSATTRAWLSLDAIAAAALTTAVFVR